MAHEYHWLFTDNAGTKRELVYSTLNNKWFPIDRGTGQRIEFAINVSDVNGFKYTYGFLSTGYMLRLENGNTFNGTAITGTLQTGDMLPVESLWALSQLISHMLVTKGKSTTVNTIEITHYGDSSTSGTALTAVETTPVTGRRVVQSEENINLGDHITHSLKYTMTTDDETWGFEPMFAVLEYNVIGQDKEAR